MRNESTVFAFLAAAAAWPAALCALTDAMATPLQRAMQASWCGAGPQAGEFLGHCSACWSGAAMFVLAAVMAATAPKPRLRAAPSAASE